MLPARTPPARRLGTAPAVALAAALGVALAAALAAALAPAAPAPAPAPPLAAAKGAAHPWPPPPEKGKLFVHYGEEHWDDDDGLRILPRVVRSSARYGPDLVTMSADKAADDVVEKLERWKELMSPYDRRGIPYFAAVGNHDRAGPGMQGVDPFGDIATYVQVFADRPYPFGDAPPPDDRRFEPGERPQGDPDGASSHYAFEYGPVRWIFLDNSCFSLSVCDSAQNPPFPDEAGNQGQYDFLAAEAARAAAEGDLAFVVMHMPTQDPRPGHTQPTPSDHTMGEGLVPPASEENAQLEAAAAAAGVDGVFLGHIKGQWTYGGEGGVPYYIDGGAGGEVYVGDGEETGVDYGYWHGYRLIWVKGGRVRRTDTVPVFAADGIEVEGPRRVRGGERAAFSATGQQPTEEGPDVKLELRDPDPARPNAANLPSPARVWRSSDPAVLRPLAARDDDPRRNRRRETVSGRFRALCPGTATIAVRSGWESAGQRVTVMPGPPPVPARCE